MSSPLRVPCVLGVSAVELAQIRPHGRDAEYAGDALLADRE